MLHGKAQHTACYIFSKQQHHCIESALPLLRTLLVPEHITGAVISIRRCYISLLQSSWSTKIDSKGHQPRQSTLKAIAVNPHGPVMSRKWVLENPT